jgi:hypothetical protein
MIEVSKHEAVMNDCVSSGCWFGSLTKKISKLLISDLKVLEEKTMRMATNELYIVAKASDAIC